MLLTRHARFGDSRSARPDNPEIDHDEIRPFGRGGVGNLTGHPVGLLVVAAVVLISFEALPPAGLFIVASLAVGGIFGFILWLRHR